MMGVTKSDSIANLAAALVAAQSELKNPPKDQWNPFHKSKYADLASVREYVVPVLQKHGLAVTQFPTTDDGKPGLCSILLHVSGEYISTTIKICPAKEDPQGIGAAITYARRYALQSIAGVVADVDDDGNEASGHTASQQQTQKSTQQSSKVAPPPPLSDYQQLVQEFLNAKDDKALLKAWKRYEAGSANLSKQERAEIVRLKDERKVALGIPNTNAKVTA